jgi:hypothetical protein
MALDRETLKTWRRMCAEAEANRNDDPSPLDVLETGLEIVAFAIESTRARGGTIDEVDVAELVCLDDDCETLAELATDLRRLGYIRVAARLKQMSKQKRRKPHRDRGRFEMLRLGHREAMKATD